MHISTINNNIGDATNIVTIASQDGAEGKLCGRKQAQSLVSFPTYLAVVLTLIFI